MRILRNIFCAIAAVGLMGGAVEALKVVEIEVQGELR